MGRGRQHRAVAADRVTTAMSRRRTSADERTKAALWFAGQGFGVFSVWSTREDGTCRCPQGTACTSPGKHPITPNGFQDATTDATRIRTLLSAGSEPNYGLVCPDGVFALDVDGPDLDRLAALEDRLSPLPPTLRTHTANGQHIFLRWPTAQPRPLHKMFGFVTRWGSGRQAGYVVGPRSMHQSGVAYEPEGPFEIAEMPEGWVGAALEGRESDLTITVGSAADILPEPGHRHEWLRDRARYFRGFMDNPDTLRAAVLAENARLTQPKTAEEVERAIGEVWTNFPPDPPAEVQEKVSRRLGDDELDILGTSSLGEFPAPPSEAAFGGLLGSMVEDLAAGTDASRVGLLGSLLAFCGALVPGRAYWNREQTSSPFIALVGESSIGRKGTAMNRVADAMADAVQIVTVNRAVLDGVNSGEGLVTALHYKREHFASEPTVGLILEEEYATLMASRGREGSTLDMKMRQAFDGGPLSNRRSGDTKVVTPPYWLPALVAITPIELRQRLEPGAMQSGSANRWLYLPVVRRPMVPTNEIPAFGEENRERLVAAHRAAANRPPEVIVDPAVGQLLRNYEDFLHAHETGLGRDLTKRFPAIAFRVALVHALVESSRLVTIDHVDRGLALTEYARRGVTWIFGDTIGNPDAGLMFRHLQAAGSLSRTTINRQIVRDPIRRQAAIDELIRIGRAEVVTVHTSGRARTELRILPKAGAFYPFSHVPAIRLEELVPNVERMEISAQTVVNKLAESREEVVKKSGTKIEWCHYFVEHQSSHRDVSSDPWCEICSPKEAA